LMRRLKNWKIQYGDEVIKKLQSSYQLKTAQDLYFMIAEEKIDLLDIKGILINEEKEETEIPVASMPEKESGESANIHYSDFLVIEDKVDGLDYRLSKCCNPVFGDRIFGFVTISEGIKIHRTNCPNAQYMIAKYPYRIVNAQWTASKNNPSFRSSIKITGIEDISIVNKIADIISEYKVTLRSFNYDMADGVFEGILTLMVPNNNVLQGVIKRISNVKGVHRAIRSD